MSSEVLIFSNLLTVSTYLGETSLRAVSNTSGVLSVPCGSCDVVVTSGSDAATGTFPVESYNTDQ